jgi:ATP-dependent DNA helicase DinG
MTASNPTKVVFIKDPTPVTGTQAANRAVELLRAFVDTSDGVEHRPQQERMVAEVARATCDRENLIVQAGTGTGKSIAYSLGVIAAGHNAVVSTATKQLGEQLINTDLPLLADGLAAVTDRPFTYTLLKGRQNYICRMKVDEAVSLDAEAAESNPGGDMLNLGVESDAEKRAREERENRPGGDDLTDFQELIAWSETATTGDRSDAPVVSDWAWNQVSVDANECVGRGNCEFGDTCFAEAARERARTSSITVVNHALLAADLNSPQPLFGDKSVIVVDEVHEFEKYLSNAWGAEIEAGRTAKAVRQAAKRLGKDEKAKENAAGLIADLLALADVGSDVEPGPLEELPDGLRALLDSINNKAAVLVSDLAREADKTEGAKGGHTRSASQSVQAIREQITMLLIDSPEMVRWAERDRDERLILKTAPLRVGPMLQDRLADRNLIGTSATCAVGGQFDALANTLALPDGVILDESGMPIGPRPWSATDVGTPFDWPNIAMLYVPGPDFPLPVGKERTEHNEAVLNELTELVLAAGGRTLFLSTTTAGARRAAEHLRANVPVAVYAHGDGTAGQLADWFINDEQSVLCATMGMWAGLSPSGITCSLVVIDKIPFPPMDDPLTNARSKAADDAGKSGFYEVSVTHAALMLAQGAGRLIRTTSDKGVIAILDRRLVTKSYGRHLLRSLPPIRMFHDRDTVTGALTRLTGGLGDLAGNPPAGAPGTGSRTPSRRSGKGASSKPATWTATTSATKKPWGGSAGTPVTKTQPRKSG